MSRPDAAIDAAVKPPAASIHDIAARVISLDVEGRSLETAADVLLEVGRTLSGRLNVTQVLEQLGTLAMRATDAERCGVFLREGESHGVLRPVVGAIRAGDKDTLAVQFRHTEPIDLSATAGFADLINANGPIALEQAADSPLVPEAWRAWNSKSLALSFMRAGGQVYGMLVVDWTTGFHRFSPEELGVLDAIACSAGIAIRNAQLVDQLSRGVELQRRLFECGAALRADQSLEEACAPVLDGFVSLLSAASCGIYLVDSAPRRLRPVVWRGSEHSPSEIVLSDLPAAGVAQVRHMWQRDTHRPLMLRREQVEDAWQVMFPPTVDTALFVPLTDGAQIVGIVAAGRSGHGFDETELSVARAFADLASAAVARSRLTELLQARLRLIEAMHRLGELVAGTSGARALLATLNESVCAGLGMECVALTLVDPTIREGFRLPRPTSEDDKLLREWQGYVRAKAGPVAQIYDRQIAVPVMIQNRIAGLLRVNTLKYEGGDSVGFVHAIAAAIGEVALKAKLRRDAERRAQELVVADERERIARDLHDTVGQTLYGIGLDIQDLLEDVTDPELAERLGNLRALTAQGVAKVRSAVYSLSFLHVRARGFVPSLRALVRQFARATGVNAELRVVGQVPRLSEELKGALYRMAHEGLINVERHARAATVTLTLTAGAGSVELAIRDDGVGLDQRQVADWRSAAHFGMRTMAKWIKEVGGTFQVSQAQPRGLLIRGAVPIVDPLGRP